MDDLSDLYQEGLAAYKVGNADLAQKALSRIIESGKAAPEVFADLGVINRELGNYEIAKDLLNIAVKRVPHNADFNYNLALIYSDLDDYSFAEKHYTEAIRLNPNMFAAHNNLGNIKKNKKDFKGAKICYEQAIKIDKNYITAYKNLADLYETMGDFTSAKKTYSKAIYLRSDVGLRIREALALPFVAESKEQINECREQLTTKLNNLLADDIAIEDPIRDVGATNFLLAYHGFNDKEIQVKISELYLKACPSLAFVAPHSKDWMAGLEGGIPRIGFISSFFHNHTIALLNKNLMLGLPKARFEVFIFSFSSIDDTTAKDFRMGTPSFVLLPKNLTAARQRIAEAQLDILYYTDIGMDPLTYFLGFSRLAPIQCVSWGHPVTTGLPDIDYFLSGALIEPENAQDSYSEKLYKFDGLPTSVSLSAEFKNIEKDLDSVGQNIVCPQSLFKFHPDFDLLLGKILRTLPKANIQIIDGNYSTWSKLLKNRMMRQMSDVSDRVEIIPRTDKHGMARLIYKADVILDTLHFSGGMTTFESLGVGTPVVTLPGDYMRSRVSMGIYKKMDMMHCVAENSEHYIEITKRLCLDNAFAKKVKIQIKEGHKKIFDDRSTIGHHAKFFEQKMFE